MHQPACHNEEFRGHFHIKMLFEHVEILVRDQTDSDIGNFKLVAFEKRKEQVKRALEYIQLDIDF